MKRYCLEVSGEFACFTRPEMKVERVSYDVMTPSAARAVFEAILWKPGLRWIVRRIDVLRPIRWVNLRRNEVGAVASVRNVQQVMAGKSMDLGIYVEDERQQRGGLFLRDVAYRIHADLDLVDPNPKHKGHHAWLQGAPVGPDEGMEAKQQNTLPKFMTMFERRAARGQCVNQPYLGCREFAARFRPVAPDASDPAGIDETRDLGWMLHDLDFTNPADPQPLFFRAQMNRGAIEVPPMGHGEVRA
jgi:CRISPR-associated protein Cas5d